MRPPRGGGFRGRGTGGRDSGGRFGGGRGRGRFGGGDRFNEGPPEQVVGMFVCRSKGLFV